MILTTLSAIVHPALRHLIEPDASLTDLRVDEIDLWSVRDTIERDQGRVISDGEMARWVCVADLLALEVPEQCPA